MPTNETLLTFISRATPRVPADAQVAIASSAQNVPDALSQAESINSYGDSTTMVNHMNQMSTDEQHRIWDSAQPQMQAMLVGAGYKLPKKDRGLFSRAAHDVFGAPSAVYRQTGRAIGAIPVVGDAAEATKDFTGHWVGSTLNALGSGQRFVQHVYRAGALADREDYMTNGGLTPNSAGDLVRGIVESSKAGLSFLHLTDNDDWADAWNKTSRGEQTFDPRKLREIRDGSGFDDMTLGLAQAAAGGQKDITAYLEAQLAKGMSQEQVGKLYNSMEDDKFKEVVGQLNDSKLSFGRGLVPDALWEKNHTAATAISGFGDAVFSFADPFLVGGKVNKAAKIARYGFKTPEEMQALLSKPAVKNWLDDVSSYLGKEDYAGLANRHPQLMPIMQAFKDQGVKTSDDLASKLTLQQQPESLVAARQAKDEAERQLKKLEGLGDEVTEDDLRKAMEAAELTKVKTSEELAKWMEGQVISMHILSGRGTAVNHGIQMVPKMNAAGKAFLDAKGTLKKAIDWTADVGVKVDGDDIIQTGGAATKAVRMLGGTARKLTTLTPQSMKMDPTDPNTVLNVQRFASSYLPAESVDLLVNNWVKADTIGARRGVYMEMLGQTFKAMGVDMSDDASLMNHFLDTAERGIVRQKYSPGGNDHMKNIDGMVESNGLLEKHLTTEWALPSFNDLAANAQRSRFMQMVYKVGNNPLADGFSKLWKPAQLFRIGYPVRNSIEELAIASVRENPIALAKAAIARDRTAAEVGGTFNGPLSDLNPVESAVSRLIREIPEKDWVNINTLEDLQAKVLAGRTKKIFDKVAGAAITAIGALPGTGKTGRIEDYEKTIRRYNGTIFKGGLTGEISSIETGRLAGWAADPLDAADDLRNGVQKSPLTMRPPARIKPNGDYQEYVDGQFGFTSAWMKMLDDVGGSNLARKVLEHDHLEPQELRSTIADYLESSEFSDYWKKAARSTKTSDGRIVGEDATPREAAMDWADKVVNHVQGLLPTDMVPDAVQSARKALPGATQGLKDITARQAALREAMDSITNLGEYQRYAKGTVNKIEAGAKKTKETVTLSKEFGKGEAKYVEQLLKGDAFKGLPHKVKVLLNNEGKSAEDITRLRDELNNLEGEIGRVGGLKDVAGQLSGRESFIKHMLDKSQSPDMNQLTKIAKDFRPKSVVGPEFVELPLGGVQGVISEFIDRGFERMGHAVDYWSRQPLYINAVHKADTDLRPMIEGIFGEGAMADEILEVMVRDRADAETLMYVDNPRIRSQMNVLTRNLAPFQHAQEQFLKRWGKTFVHSPDAMIKAALGYHALLASGIVHKDDQGNTVFTYPMSQYIQPAVTRGLKLVGIDAYLPVNQAFTGQVKMLAPGFDVGSNFRPSFGPMVSVPMNALARKFPELQNTQTALLGQIGSNRPYWELMVPSTIARTVNALTANDSTNAAYATAQMQAIQDLEANGHGLPDDYTPRQREQYMERVKQWTRINMFVRNAVGFSVPASPTSDIGSTVIGQKLRTLSDAGLSFTEAVKAIQNEDPDSYPYAVFMSEGAGSQPLPSTKDAGELMDKHRSFFDNYNMAGGFFLPQESSDGKFDYQTYKEQLMYDMRKRRTPDEYMDQIMYARASGDYYATRDAHYARIENLKGAALQQENNTYAQWKAQYLDDHPVFADGLQSQDSKIKRGNTLDQLRAALVDPDAPDTPQVANIADLIATYDGYTSRLAPWAAMTTTRAEKARKAERERFITWAEGPLKTDGTREGGWLDQNPTAQDTYNSLIKPEVDPDGR